LQFRHLCRALGGFIGSQIKRNQYRKTNRIGGTKSTRKKTQAGEEGRRVCCESFEEKPRRRRSIPRRPFCLSSISPLTQIRKRIRAMSGLLLIPLRPWLPVLNIPTELRGSGWSGYAQAFTGPIGMETEDGGGEIGTCKTRPTQRACNPQKTGEEGAHLKGLMRLPYFPHWAAALPLRDDCLLGL